MANKTIADLELTAARVVQEYINTHSESTLKKKIIGELDSHVKKILYGTMGFSINYGSPAVDHCNGREPAITRWVKEQSEGIVKEWFSNLPETTFKLTTEMEDALVKEYRQSFMRTASRKVREAADLAARNIVREMALDAINPLQLVAEEDDV
jgi:hypothetical protein